MTSPLPWGRGHLLFIGKTLYLETLSRSYRSKVYPRYNHSR